MEIVDNYEAKIWVGLRAEYTDLYFSTMEVMDIVHPWCNENKQCVTVSKTDYVYVQTDETGVGHEPGVIIGFINYPRYPLSKAEIKNRAMDLGKKLMKSLKQHRVSITFYPTVPGGVMMLEKEDLK